MPLPVIHIGYFKTGTTTLQGNVFAAHGKIANVGKPGPAQAAREVVAALAGKGTIAAAREAWRDLVDGLPEERTPVLSQEALATLAIDHPDLPQALADIVGPARILITVRRQAHLIESLYIHQEKVARHAAPDAWLADNTALFLKLLDFEAMAARFAAVFGAGNVHVLPLELLRDDPADYARRLGAVLDMPGPDLEPFLARPARNQRKSRRELIYIRLRSALAPGLRLSRCLPAALARRFQGFLGGGQAAAPKFSAARLRDIEAHLAPSNARLAASHGVPLRALGYAVTGTEAA